MDSQLEKRYARQLALPEIGEEGQKKLSKSSVLLVGVGGLGSAAGYYLAAAGVGTIGICDDDEVEVSNLQRQIAHRTTDVGTPKRLSAGRAFLALNPDLIVRSWGMRLTADNAQAILGGFDFVIDATDNFMSKFVIAATCHGLGKPYSYAGVEAFTGQTITVMPGKSACCRCVFEKRPEDPEGTRGPLGVVPGVIGAIQALEAIKSVVGFGKPLTNRLLVFDALECTFREVKVKRNKACPLCGEK